MMKSLVFQGVKKLGSFIRSFWQPVGLQMWVELDWFVLPSARETGGVLGGCTCSCSVVAVEDFVFARSAAVLPLRRLFLRCHLGLHTHSRSFWLDTQRQQSLVDNKHKVFVDRWTWTGTQLVSVCVALGQFAACWAIYNLEDSVLSGRLRVLFFSSCYFILFPPH